MNIAIGAERTLTELDFSRLKKLAGGAAPALLDSDFEYADQVPSREVPADVVTMYSQVEVRDLDTGARRTLTLCYPKDAQPTSGMVSVLSPVGASLLGLRVGATAQWHTPMGDLCRAQVAALLFQPEASGDYTA